MKVLISALMFMVVMDSGIAQDNDSYLSALQNSHDVDTLQDGDNRVAREDFSPSVEHHHHDHSVASSPVPNYEYPKQEYGVPSYNPSYNPKTEYGPPSYNFKPIYGAPINHPVYRVPHHHYEYLPSPTYSAPRDNWFSLDKFKFNFDMYTIGKILLKLLIFKKVIKFMALICLLLFLPKFQSDSTSTTTVVHDEGRSFNAKYDLKARIDESTKFAVTAMNAFKRKYPDSCIGPMDLSCKFGKMFDTIDDKYSYERILQLYLPDSVQPEAEDSPTETS